MPETIGYERNTKIRTKLSKEMHEKLKHAHDRLLRGQNFRKKREPVWRQSYEQYLGDPTWSADRSDPSADLVSVNSSFATINVLVPFVSDEDPTFVVSPLSGDANVENATVLQSFLNRYWRSSEMQGKLHIQESTFDYLLYGDGYLKVGYEITERPTYDGLGDEVETEVEIAKFKLERVNPWDVWIDPYADSIYNARWVCQRIMMPRMELLNDERYKTSKEMEGGDLEHDNMSPEDLERLREVEDWVTVYEFYDLKENYMIAFLAGGTVAVRYIEHIKCPIVQVPNYRIPNSPYHMGELEQVHSLQNELNKTRSQMITHRRRNVAKWIVREHALTEEGEEALKSSKVNDVIPVRGNDPFDTLIAPVHATPIASDIYAMDAQIRQDINDVTGVNEFLRGSGLQNTSKTATEATIIEGATNIRTRHKLLQIETAARQAGQLLLDIMRDVMPLTSTEEMAMFITGREAEKLNRVTGQENVRADARLIPNAEIFQGRYQVEVERGSTELRNPQAKANKLKEMSQMMISALPIMHQFGILVNVKEIIRMWFEAEGIEDVDALFEVDEDQMQAQQILLAQQIQGAQGGSSGEVVGGTRTSPGSPRPQTTRPPSERISEENSGMLGPTY